MFEKLPPRLDLIAPAELAPAQLALYNAITGGPRAGQAGTVPITDADGRLLGPFAVMLLSPDVGNAIQQVGAKIRFGAALTGRERELAILSVAGVLRSDFERLAHEPAARNLGLAQAQINAALAGQIPDDLSTDEAMVCRLARVMTADRTLSDEDYSDGIAVLGRERLSELTWLVFAIVSIGLFMASIDQTIVATALPAIERDLHAGINWSGWTITIYALGQVIAMPMAGKISDMYGRKKVFGVSAVVFTIASLCCGFAPNMPLLLLPRFIQALGGGAFMPSATGIVSDHFGSERDRAVGMFTSILPVGGIIGPIVGGIFVSYWSWRGIFLVNVPIGILLIALTIKFIPSSTAKEAGGEAGRKRTPASMSGASPCSPC